MNKSYQITFINPEPTQVSGPGVPGERLVLGLVNNTAYVYL